MSETPHQRAVDPKAVVGMHAFPGEAAVAGNLARLVSREEVAERTMAFRFERPAGWRFEAGQWIDVTLLDLAGTDTADNTRAFSIASAPHEEHLTIATRLRDTAYKRALSTMPLGTAVKMQGPFGDLTLHDNSGRAAIFLAGGIGITPFRSIVFHAAKEKLSHPISLFFSNRRPEDVPFLEELQSLGKENPNYQLIATLSGTEKSDRPWHGETGRIDYRMLLTYAKNAASPIYYIAGPPRMVNALQQMLSNAGVNSSDVHSEEFFGY